MVMRASRFVWTACVLVMMACGGGGTPVQTPTTLSAGTSPAHTEQVILDALPKRGWTTENVQPFRVLAFLAVRSHLLRVEIRYDERQVAIYYVDSDNLAAHIGSDGQVYAHKRVNSWIRQLALDIAAGLSAPASTSGGVGAPPGSAPPGAAGAGQPTTAPPPPPLPPAVPGAPPPR
jgi:hypothetical protein